MLKILKYLYHLPSHLIHALHIRKMKFRCKTSNTVKLFPSCIINNPQNKKDAIEIDDYTVILGQLLVLKDSGRIKVGKHAYIGTNTKIWSADSIEIGDRVFVSFGVNIHDYDAHSISATKRHEQFKEIFVDGRNEPIDDVKHEGIVIEEDAWIGFNASILKGVRIGKGAIVGGCAVVTRNVEPYTIVAGNPAKIVGMALK